LVDLDLLWLTLTNMDDKIKNLRYLMARVSIIDILDGSVEHDWILLLARMSLLFGFKSFKMHFFELA
jgi:hypothetical protein